MTLWDVLLKVTIRNGGTVAIFAAGTLNTILYSVQFGAFAYAIAFGVRLGWGS